MKNNPIFDFRQSPKGLQSLQSQAGQASMMMALAVAGLVTVAALSVAKWSHETLQVQKTNDPNKSAQHLRENILNSLSASGVWEQSLSNNSALSNCLTNKNCAFDSKAYTDFDIYSNSGDIILNSSDGAEGFNLKGVRCHNYDSVVGNDGCPMRYVTQVRADCSILVANQCDIQIVGTLYYSPQRTGSSLVQSLNSNKYSFNFHLGAIDGTLQSACLGLGGSFNKATLGCDIGNVNLSSAKTGITLTQLTQLCPAAQQTITNAISSGTFSEITLSQCQLGSNLAKSCPSGTILAGSNPDGSNDCRRVPDGDFCLVEANIIPSGNSVVFYKTTSVPFGTNCVSESRSCINGEISGSYLNATCTILPAAECTFDGQTVANGASIKAYKVGRPDEDSDEDSHYKEEGSCTNLTRTCTNGVLSGSSTYSLSSCAPSNGKSCEFGDKRISNGKTVTAYQSAKVGFGETCVSGTVSCNNGVLSGNDLFPNKECEVSKGKSCLTGKGTEIQGGDDADYFRSAKADSGKSCTQLKVEKTCKDGILVGDVKASFEECTENHSTCKLDDKEFKSGDKAQAYTIQTSTSASSCSAYSSTRLLACNNGKWEDANNLGQDVSGFIYSKCTTQKGSDCKVTTKDNKERFIRNGGVSVLYSAIEAKNCSSMSISVSCNNGTASVAAGSYYAHCETD